MALELKVPEVGESITEVMIGTGKKREGDAVATDDSIVEIESDKATVELPAPTHGTITKILKAAGEKAVVGEVIGYLEPAAAGVTAPAAPAGGTPVVGVTRKDGRTDIGSVSMAPDQQPRVMPAAARVLGEAGVSPAAVTGTGPGGRITKPDALTAAARPAAPVAAKPPAPKPPALAPKPATAAGGGMPVSPGGPREERYVLISPIRRKIAERLVEAQQQAALLTT
ncbi:MAG: biotin/lipoyl-containing protein, partial [Planctomycetia bacterium]